MFFKEVSYAQDAFNLKTLTVSSTNIGTLGKYEQRQLWNKSALFILFIFYSKNSQNSNLSLK